MLQNLAFFINDIFTRTDKSGELNFEIDAMFGVQ